MQLLMFCIKCGFPIGGGRCMCPVRQSVPNMPNIPPPPTKRQPTELQHAQWWWCAWRRKDEKHLTYDERYTKICCRRNEAAERLDTAIRAQAQKGEQ